MDDFNAASTIISASFNKEVDRKESSILKTDLLHVFQRLLDSLQIEEGQNYITDSYAFGFQPFSFQQ